MNQRKQHHHLSPDEAKLSFWDFYKLTSSVYSYPGGFMIVIAFIILAIFTWPLEYDFYTSLKISYALKWQTFVLVLVVIYTILIGANVLRAYFLMRQTRSFSFPVYGMQNLIRNCKTFWTFRRCCVNVVFDEVRARKLLSAEEFEEIETMTLKMIAQQAKRIRFHKHITVLSGWKVEDNTANGYANWESAGRILRCVCNTLGPIHEELRIIKSVEISLPVSRFSTENSFRWLPESD